MTHDELKMEQMIEDSVMSPLQSVCRKGNCNMQLGNRDIESLSKGELVAILSAIIQLCLDWAEIKYSTLGRKIVDVLKDSQLINYNDLS